jgi:NAD(P)-dependent dehydrogenase (short-subunit alcohol dehydrogenase family)
MTAFYMLWTQQSRIANVDLDAKKARSDMTKTVLVTGASRGVGESVAQLFARKGWQVAATARNPGNLGPWAQAANVAGVHLDVTDAASIRQAVEETESRFGGIDVLVNNAGAGLGGAIEGVTRQELLALFELNVFGLVAMAQAVLPLMRRQSSGVIINVSSAAGRVGLPFLAPYSASKFAVEGLTESMDYELAPFGIRAKLVEPGGIRTEFAHDWAQSAAYDPVAASVRKRYAAGAKKAAGPRGVAEAIFRAATDKKHRLRYTANGSAALLMLNRVLPKAMWRALIEKAFLGSPRKRLG